MATTNIPIRIDAEYKARLDELSAATGRSRNHHLVEAVRRYLAEESWQIAQIQAGIVDADAGRLTPQEDVEREMRDIVAANRPAS
jgi:predicted transcriptional regulator